MNQQQQPQVSKKVVSTLALFTAAMITLPISVFFLLRHYKFSSLACGGCAAAVANGILIFYVAVAVFENDEETPQKLAAKKKKLQ